jgi:hypothetical protein
LTNAHPRRWRPGRRTCPPRRNHRQVGHDHVDAGVTRGRRHVDRAGGRLLDRLAVVAAEAVERGPALDEHPGRRDIADLDGVVLTGDDRLGDVAADLLGVDVERGDELDVRDVVVAERDVHETRDAVVRVGVPVVLHALHQG